jgi:hypothetical protein
MARLASDSARRHRMPPEPRGPFAQRRFQKKSLSANPREGFFSRKVDTVSDNSRFSNPRLRHVVGSQRPVARVAVINASIQMNVFHRSRVVGRLRLKRK